MSILRYFKKMQLLDNLIRRKATGNQKAFARKAGISRSLLNLYLNEMKELGFPISYCRHRNTYFYGEEGKMVNSLFESRITKEEQRSYNGGWNITVPLPIWLHNEEGIDINKMVI